MFDVYAGVASAKEGNCNGPCLHTDGFPLGRAFDGIGYGIGGELNPKSIRPLDKPQVHRIERA